jgi:hypothetical protein
MHPNLQVENEETIEALSARTKALLEGLQQRFLFARSIRAIALVHIAFLSAISVSQPARRARRPVLWRLRAFSPVCAFIFSVFSRWVPRFSESIVCLRWMFACALSRPIFENNRFSRA